MYLPFFSLNEDGKIININRFYNHSYIRCDPELYWC